MNEMREHKRNDTGKESVLQSHLHTTTGATGSEFITPSHSRAQKFNICKQTEVGRTSPERRPTDGRSPSDLQSMIEN